MSETDLSDDLKAHLELTRRQAQAPYSFDVCTEQPVQPPVESDASETKVKRTKKVIPSWQPQ